MAKKQRAKPDNVVSIHGGSIFRLNGVPQPAVIKLAEEILARARAGEIVGLSVAFYHSDESYSNQHAGPISFGHIGSVECLKNWLIANSH